MHCPTMALAGIREIAEFDGHPTGDRHLVPGLIAPEESDLGDRGDDREVAAERAEWRLDLGDVPDQLEGRGRRAADGHREGAVETVRDVDTGRVAAVRPHE